MQIKVQVREVYGEQRVYPACPKAVLFAKLAGTKTLTAQALSTIADLGIEIVHEWPTVTITRPMTPREMWR